MPGGGEHRPGQVEMAELVAELLAASESSLATDSVTTEGDPVTSDHEPPDRSVLAIEAGTGTGKSLAYLTPLVAAGRRCVVATATIALQEQLVAKDVPLVAAGLNRDVRAAVLKGRANYVCVQRLEELERAERSEQLQLLRGANPSAVIKDLVAWAEDSATGDREELDPAPSSDTWQAVSVGADECPGASRCPAGDRCFAEQARQQAFEADVIVTNLHYFGLDVATGGGLLPEHDAVVLDEAHHLPEVLSSTCGHQLGGQRLRNLGRRLRGVLTETDSRIDGTAERLDALLRPHRGNRLTFDSELTTTLLAARGDADNALARLRKISAAEGSDAASKVDRAVQLATSAIDTIDAIVEADADSLVTWVGGSDDHPVLNVTPLDLAPLLESGRWGTRPTVLTSATLPDGLVHQLGVGDVGVHRMGSPFDYANLGLLYCATHLPDPRESGYRAAVNADLERLIAAAGGRTLALFTSYRAMDEAADYLRESAIDGPLLVQGEASRTLLIRRFQEDPAAVLLATQSFWQGVDLPGDTLTLVTIDRIPFPRPDDPVLRARRELAGPNAFRLVDLPRAQILLAQAAGRLVRRADDRGAVAVFDRRLATNKSYRWDLIGAMPPFTRTKNIEDVETLLRSLDRD